MSQLIPVWFLGPGVNVFWEAFGHMFLDELETVSKHQNLKNKIDVDQDVARIANSSFHCQWTTQQ